MSDRTVYLETFGCQMNELDSELVRGQLEALGYRFTEDPGQASILLYNTCSVREQAENKAFSRIGLAGVRKREGEELLVGVNQHVAVLGVLLRALREQVVGVPAAAEVFLVGGVEDRAREPVADVPGLVVPVLLLVAAAVLPRHPRLKL